MARRRAIISLAGYPARGDGGIRILKRSIIAALVVVLLLLVGVFVAVQFVDTNRYRDVLAGMVEDATGREVSLDGNLRLKLLPLPSLSVNDLTFANAAWAKRQPDMLRIKHLSAEVEFWPLFEGRLVVRHFTAIEAEIYLESGPEGRGNWVFGDFEAADIDSDDSDSGLSDIPRVIVDEIHIENARFEFLDGTSGHETVVAVDEMRVGAAQPGNHASLNLRANYQDLPITVDGKIGSAGAILANRPIEVDLKGTIGETSVSLAGNVGRPLQVSDLHLDASIESAATKRLTDAFGVEVEELGPLHLKLGVAETGGSFQFDPIRLDARPRKTDATVTGSIKNFSFDLISGEGEQSAPMTVDLDGEFGDAALHIAGNIGNTLDGADPHIDASFKTKSTKALTDIAAVEFEEVGPVDLSLTLRVREGHIDIDDIALSARPKGVDASAAGSVKNLVLDSDSQHDEPAKIDLKGKFGEAQYSVNGDIGKPFEGKDLKLKVVLQAKSTQSLTQLAGAEIEEVGPIDAALTVIEKDGRFDLTELNVKAQPRGADVTVKGSIRDVVGDPEPEFDVTLAAKTLRQLDETLADAGPVDITANVRTRDNPAAGADSKDKLIEIWDFVAKVSKSDLSGSAVVNARADPPSANAKLHANVINLAEFLPEQQSDATGTEPSPDDKVFSDKPLPFGALKKANGHVELSVETLYMRKLTLEKVKVDAKLNHGRLVLSPIAHVAGGKVDATFDIDSHGQPAVVTTRVEADQVSIGDLTDAFQGDDSSKGLSSYLRMSLRGEGNSMRALMGSLDGDFRLEMGPGELRNDQLDRVGGDLLTQMFSAAVPTDEKNEVTAVNCGVVRFEIEEGGAIAEQTLVLETEKVLIQGGGLVNLKTEGLDLGANLAAREGVGIGAGTLSSVMRLRGTLAHPEMATDLKGSAKAGAKIGVAVLTVGLSLVAESVYGQLSADDHPCRTALARKIEVTPEEFRKEVEAEKQ